MIRLCDQGHEVHVAYQTSGNIAVFDDDAQRHADFVSEFCRALGSRDENDDAVRIAGEVESFVRDKQPGRMDSADVRRIKALIRRTEARSAAKYSGVRGGNIHFLDLPFYETGRVRKDPVGEADIAIIVDLLPDPRLSSAHLDHAVERSDHRRVCRPHRSHGTEPVRVALEE